MRPAGPPLNVAARPVSSSQLLVTWAPPLPELRHGDIQGYYVGYREIRFAITVASLLTIDKVIYYLHR